MVKSKVTTTGQNKAEYPKIMIADDGEVVLFTSSDTGTVLVSGNDDGDASEVGFHMRGWNIDFFKDFHGSVTLSNEG